MYKRLKYRYEVKRLLESLPSEEPGSRTNKYGKNIGNAINTEVDQILKTKPLTQNSECNVCFRIGELLTPTQLHVCGSCALRIQRKTGQTNFRMKPHLRPVPCEICVKPTRMTAYINPEICDGCFTKIGDRHRRRHIDKTIAKYRNRKYDALVQPANWGARKVA